MKGFPPDPYEVLGVEKDARLPEIRSAHRKLVLKCHPDKVQDAALKAIRQDEVHKIQQAYELLSDDTKRQQYDDQVKLFELRKEMGKGNPTPRSNPFGYKVETAGPRANSYARLASNSYKYAGAAPRSHEDLYNEPMKYTPKKSTSYESATRDRDRRQLFTREDDARRYTLRKIQEEERLARQAEKRARDKRARAKERIQSEKARDKDRRERSHKDKTKSKDKERKSQTEEKAHIIYVEDDYSSEEVYRSAKAAKAQRRTGDEIRMCEELATAMRAEEARAMVQAQKAQIKEAPMDSKWSDHRDFAGAYMQAAHQKVAIEAEDDRHHPHSGIQRTEMFAARYMQSARRNFTDESFQNPPACSPRLSDSYPAPSYQALRRSSFSTSERPKLRRTNSSTSIDYSMRKMHHSMGSDGGGSHDEGLYKSLRTNRSRPSSRQRSHSHSGAYAPPKRSQFVDVTGIFSSPSRVSHEGHEPLLPRSESSPFLRWEAPKECFCCLKKLRPGDIVSLACQHLWCSSCLSRFV